MQIILPMKQAEMYVVTSNQSEANEIIDEMSSVMRNTADPGVYPEDIKCSNPNPIADENIAINTTIFNLGTNGALFVTLQFFDNGAQIGENATIGYMPFLDRIPVNITWNPSQGMHTVTVRINPDRTMAELDYTNNEASRNLYVYEKPETNPPNITDVKPGNATAFNGTALAFSCNVTDESGVKWVRLNYSTNNWTSYNTKRMSNPYDDFYSTVLTLFSGTQYKIGASDNYGTTGNSSIYSVAVKKVFNTGPGTYPSLSGTHKGEIRPAENINVSKLYTYPCAGTGGHSESIELEENGSLIAYGTWNGYADYHYIALQNASGAPYVMLLLGHKYNYTIVTGSYPQIIHAHSKDVIGGTITCTSFVDANGKVYDDWIPAIRLEWERNIGQ